MSLWREISHPCVWMTPDDFPRLRENAQLPFWKGKLDAYRAELAELSQLSMQGPTGSMGMTGYSSVKLDFHPGVNKMALKAALCHSVDQDEHSGKLIATFLEEVLTYYRTKSPIWRDLMGGLNKGTWTGEYWGGLAESHIIDPMIWFSTAHMYDMIYGKGYLADEQCKAFEHMMSLFHQLCCLHEEMQKMDNNRAAWLNGGSFLSAMFDENPIRAKVTMDKCIGNMPRLVSTILDDGLHYEIGPYHEAAVTAIHYAARIIRNATGKDFFKAGDYGPGFEAAYNGWVNRLIPGSSLRIWTQRDRIDHWDTTCFGYLEYHIPELGWAINRINDRDWVPMFRHWPQGAEFYAYKQPDNATQPAFLDSHFDHGGAAIFRSSWQADAQSMYFRYGFQGSSHGGGLDKLNIELTCNDEPIICDPWVSELSHDKNVVIVDGHTQQQCTGKCLHADVENGGRLQVISALSGLGKVPDRPFIHDPRSEIGYWCTRYDECFPEMARQRRSMLFVDRRYWIIRDTLWSLDEKEHQYQWLYHSFGIPQGLGPQRQRVEHSYDVKRRYWSERPLPEKRLTNRHPLLTAGQYGFASDKAAADMHFVGVNIDAPTSVDLWQGAGKHHYNGTSEGGDGLAMAPFFGTCFTATGKDVALITVIDARPVGKPVHVQAVESLAVDGVDGHLLQIQTTSGKDIIQINEADQAITLDGKTIEPGYQIL